MQLEGTDNSDNGGNLAFMIPWPRRSDVAVDESNTTRSSDEPAERSRRDAEARHQRISGSLCTFGDTEARGPQPVLAAGAGRRQYVQVGFTLGGPIKRNKLFFFGDYVRTNDDSGRLTGGNVPEVAFRNSDFSGSPTRIYDPATGDADGRDARSSGNQIPLSRISPIARSSRQGPDAEILPARRSARPISSCRTCAKNGRTSGTSR